MKVEKEEKDGMINVEIAVMTEEAEAVEKEEAEAVVIEEVVVEAEEVVVLVAVEGEINLSI
jgi:methenyltetrahydromethanopterin cyclohydrolase